MKFYVEGTSRMNIWEWLQWFLCQSWCVVHFVSNFKWSVAANAAPDMLTWYHFHWSSWHAKHRSWQLIISTCHIKNIFLHVFFPTRFWTVFGPQLAISSTVPQTKLGLQNGSSAGLVRSWSWQRWQILILLGDYIDICRFKPNLWGSWGGI